MFKQATEGIFRGTLRSECFFGDPMCHGTVSPCRSPNLSSQSLPRARFQSKSLGELCPNFRLVIATPDRGEQPISSSSLFFFFRR